MTHEALQPPEDNLEMQVQRENPHLRWENGSRLDSTPGQDCETGAISKRSNAPIAIDRPALNSRDDHSDQPSLFDVPTLATSDVDAGRDLLLVTRPTNSLRPHPALLRLQIGLTVEQLLNLEGIGKAFATSFVRNR